MGREKKGRRGVGEGSRGKGSGERRYILKAVEARGRVEVALLQAARKGEGDGGREGGERREGYQEQTSQGTQ